VRTLKHSRQTFPIFMVTGAILLGLVVPAYTDSPHRAQGKMYYQTGKYKDAFTEYLKSIELQEENSAALFSDSAYYWGYWTAVENLKQPKDAAVILLKATNIWPETIEIRRLLCQTYRQLNDPANAEKYQNLALDMIARKADQLHKSNEYHYTLAQLYETAGSYEKAFEEYQKAVTSGEEARRLAEKSRWDKKTIGSYPCVIPYLANSAYYKGSIMGREKLAETEKALRLLKQAGELFTDVGQINSDIARQYLALLKDYERAEEYYRKALEIVRVKPDQAYGYVFDGNPIRGRKVSKEEREAEWGPVNPFDIEFVVQSVWLANCYIDEVEDSAPQKMQANLDQAYTLPKRAMPATQLCFSLSSVAN